MLVDTSALHALLDRRDPEHEQARQTFQDLVKTHALLTHNYMVLEAIALTQRRLGMSAVRALSEGILPVIEHHWVRPGLHERAMAALLAAERSSISLVDWTSFELMRELNVRTAFAFDADFRAHGFELVP
ncbi:MAG: type II toxin-antitoxin system VapC family toxin [Candidatus Limnocylindria bacterium]